MNSLPNNILEKIFQLVSLKDVLTCTSVCSHWKQIINQETFWKELLRKRFNVKPSKKKFALSIIKTMWKDDWVSYGRMHGRDRPTIKYVFKPFPVVLKNGVITPHDFKAMEANNCKNIVVALAKLKILLKG